MVDKCADIDPERCRASVMRFAPAQVAAGYETAYERAAARRGAAAPAVSP
jgi:hypothetical protein